MMSLVAVDVNSSSSSKINNTRATTMVTSTGNGPEEVDVGAKKSPKDGTRGTLTRSLSCDELLSPAKKSNKPKSLGELLSMNNKAPGNLPSLDDEDKFGGQQGVVENVVVESKEEAMNIFSEANEMSRTDSNGRDDPFGEFLAVSNAVVPVITKLNPKFPVCLSPVGKQGELNLEPNIGRDEDDAVTEMMLAGGSHNGNKRNCSLRLLSASVPNMSYEDDEQSAFNFSVVDFDEDDDGENDRGADAIEFHGRSEKVPTTPKRATEQPVISSPSRGRVSQLFLSPGCLSPTKSPAASAASKNQVRTPNGTATTREVCRELKASIIGSAADVFKLKTVDDAHHHVSSNDSVGEGSICSNRNTLIVDSMKSKKDDILYLSQLTKQKQQQPNSDEIPYLKNALKHVQIRTRDCDEQQQQPTDAMTNRSSQPKTEYSAPLHDSTSLGFVSPPRSPDKMEKKVMEETKEVSDKPPPELPVGPGSPPGSPSKHKSKKGKDHGGKKKQKIKLNPSDLGLSIEESKNPMKLQEAFKRWKKEQTETGHGDEMSIQSEQVPGHSTKHQAGRSRLARELQRGGGDSSVAPRKRGVPRSASADGSEHDLAGRRTRALSRGRPKHSGNKEGSSSGSNNNGGSEGSDNPSKMRRRRSVSRARQTDSNTDGSGEMKRRTRSLSRHHRGGNMTTSESSLEESPMNAAVEKKNEDEDTERTSSQQKRGLRRHASISSQSFGGASFCSAATEITGNTAAADRSRRLRSKSLGRPSLTSSWLHSSDDEEHPQEHREAAEEDHTPPMKASTEQKHRNTRSKSLGRTRARCGSADSASSADEHPQPLPSRGRRRSPSRGRRRPSLDSKLASSINRSADSKNATDEQSQPLPAGASSLSQTRARCGSADSVSVTDEQQQPLPGAGKGRRRPSLDNMVAPTSATPSRSRAKSRSGPRGKKDRSKSRGRKGADGNPKRSRSRDVRKERKARSSDEEALKTPMTPKATKNSYEEESGEFASTESSPIRSPSVVPTTETPNTSDPLASPERTLSPKSGASVKKGISSRISALKRTFLKGGKGGGSSSTEDINESTTPSVPENLAVSHPSPTSPSKALGELSPSRSKNDRHNLGAYVPALSMRDHYEDGRDGEPPSPGPAQECDMNSKEPQHKRKSPKRTASLTLWAQKAGQSSREESSPVPGKRGCGVARIRSVDGNSSVEWAEVDFSSMNGTQPYGEVIERRGVEVAGYQPCDLDDDNEEQTMMGPGGVEAEEAPRSNETGESAEDILKKLRKAGITPKQLNKLKAHGLKITEE